VGALLALALDLAVADQAIEPRGSCEYQGRGSGAWLHIITPLQTAALIAG
jgi:hypothetical protein